MKHLIKQLIVCSVVLAISGLCSQSLYSQEEGDKPPREKKEKKERPDGEKREKKERPEGERREKKERPPRE